MRTMCYGICLNSIRYVITQYVFGLVVLEVYKKIRQSSQDYQKNRRKLKIYGGQSDKVFRFRKNKQSFSQ